MNRTLLNKEVLTTGEVARICHVAPRTVSKWFDTGQLRGYRIPGSRDRRIPLEHLLAFMRANGLPMDELDGRFTRVLIIDHHASQQDADALGAAGQFDVRIADNEFDAGVLAQQFKPHVIVLDITARTESAGRICQDIKSNPLLAGVHVIAVSDQSGRDDLDGQYFDLLMSKSVSSEELAEAIRRQLEADEHR